MVSRFQKRGKRPRELTTVAGAEVEFPGDIAENLTAKRIDFKGKSGQLFSKNKKASPAAGRHLLGPPFFPPGSVIDGPIHQGGVEPNIMAGFFTAQPFVLHDFFSLGYEFLVKRGILEHGINGIVGHGKYVGRG